MSVYGVKMKTQKNRETGDFDFGFKIYDFGFIKSSLN